MINTVPCRSARGRVAATLLAGLAIVAVSAPSAWADTEVPVTTDSVAQLIDEVAPGSQVATAPTAVTKQGITYVSGTAQIAVPTSTDGSVSVKDQGVQTVTIGLPDEAQTKKVQVAGDGTAVYIGDEASVAVQSLNDGSVRLQTITSSSAGPLSYTYPIEDGVTPLLQPDGSVNLLRQLGDMTVSVGTVAPAWARDAAGRPVATSYSIDGSNLVQNISPSADTQFPVVADPQLTFGQQVVYVNAWGYQWRTLAKAETALGGAGILVACVKAKVPDAWTAFLKAACGSIGGSNLNNMIKWIRQENGRGVDNIYDCYQIGVLRPQGLVKVTAEGNCVPKK